jgi:hypothetical protein
MNQNIIFDVKKVLARIHSEAQLPEPDRLKIPKAERETIENFKNKTELSSRNRETIVKVSLKLLTFR